MKHQSHILHILPHAGGGVGTVMRSILAAESIPGCPYTHTVASLEYLNEITQRHCDLHHVRWIDKVVTQQKEELHTLLNEADIVIVHWWNHPLMMKFLFRGIPPTRLIMWSHVNGFFPPQAFFATLFDMPDWFAFTSKTSFSAPVVQMLPDRVKPKLRVIRSCSGIPEGAEDFCEKVAPFQSGYVGTVEAVKMHRDFLGMCANANIPSPSIVAGGPAHEELRKKAADLSLTSRFNILGPVTNPKEIYKQLHAFAYPLSPRHYGTGEQVLIEAMAYGAVPVVLSNPPEEAIVKHNETGLVAENADDFSAALRKLMKNPDERDRLARGGHRFVMGECGIEHTIRAFHALFDEALSLPKRPRKLQLKQIGGVTYGSPLHLFLASLGDTEDRQIFEEVFYNNRVGSFPEDFDSKTRGTSFHYLDMLGNDPQLEAICDTVMSSRNRYYES